MLVTEGASQVGPVLRQGCALDGGGVGGTTRGLQPPGVARWGRALAAQPPDRLRAARAGPLQREAGRERTSMSKAS